MPRAAAARLLGDVATAAAGLAIVAFPVVAHLVHPVVASLATAVLAIAAFTFWPAAAAAAVIMAAIFQNLFVSIVSPGVAAGDDFVIIRSYNFQLLAAVWGLSVLTHFLTWRGFSREVDRLLAISGIALAAIVFYFALGLMEAGQAAAIYLRNIATGLLLYQTMLILSRAHGLRLSTVFAIIAGIVIVLGYTEFLFRDDWLRFTNGESFWNLAMADEKNALMWDREARQTGIVTLGLQDSFKVVLFNTPLLSDLGIEVKRLFGPNMHAISYSYAIAFLMVVTAYSRRFALAAALLPLLIFANAKGAVITVLATVAGSLLAWVFGRRFAFAGLAGLLAVYAVAGVVVGLAIGDFHVLGLMGGIHNFIDFPIGHGIGAGGNLAVDFTTLSWGDFQAAGRTPIAVESSVGVLLYQMGIAAFLLIGTYVFIAWKTLLVAKMTGDPLHAAAAFALLAIVVNGLFQEEALFSPLGVGLFLALCGTIQGRFHRSPARPSGGPA